MRSTSPDIHGRLKSAQPVFAGPMSFSVYSDYQCYRQCHQEQYSKTTIYTMESACSGICPTTLLIWWLRSSFLTSGFCMIIEDTCRMYALMSCHSTPGLCCSWDGSSESEREITKGKIKPQNLEPVSSENHLCCMMVIIIGEGQPVR